MQDLEELKETVPLRRTKSVWLFIANQLGVFEVRIKHHVKAAQLAGLDDVRSSLFSSSTSNA